MSTTDIRTLLVDPDQIARRDLTAALHRHGDVRLLSRCRTAKLGAVTIRAHQPDLVFLDTRLMAPHPFLPIEDEAFADTGPALVVLTTQADYAIRGYDHGAMRYLVKPLTEGDIDETIGRVRAWIRSRRAHPTARYPNRLPVCSHQGIMLIETAVIDWIEATDHCPLVHMGHRAEPVRDGMSDLERALDPNRFVRVSRSAIVNVDRVHAVRLASDGRYVLLLANGVCIVTNRTRPGFVAPSLGL